MGQFEYDSSLPLGTNILEENRIYWCSLCINIYERLNSSAKILVRQYLDAKPWSDLDWPKYLPEIDIIVFRRLIHAIAFRENATKGVEDVRELGERLKIVYSYQMNRSDSSVLLIPQAPPIVLIPVPVVQSISLAPEDKDELVGKCLKMYRTLNDNGYRVLHEFLVTDAIGGSKVMFSTGKFLINAFKSFIIDASYIQLTGVYDFLTATCKNKKYLDPLATVKDRTSNRNLK